ncbi:Threonine dehydrogenase or related Zn-dependent dehydrogenase [Halalkaliarchaeum sp. AArc-CO]|uniref:zinc-dependent alcohol dehydrogenase n=1 Tax=unclassified Halalkaliarchaeum TaxID=2678344 RepID=UPI00217EAE79|nr:MULTISPECIES: zinc-binding alcohol dehydrogenase [unclassified Halalkaliarchaeum]MDR5672974.1 zinc-binding alcohol dehydrogenase [Halalkaliarchaeum sp. AArc-GB]UWG50316.1 Threonine dehydrogenase or related Zn-dependent dehydrogenase [Halalkaliarchaeum sp. AArc-CO]
MRRRLSFVAPGEVELERAERPTPGRNQLRVETTVSAISSGTELLIYRGEAPERLPIDESLPAFSGRFTYPLRYGYAAVGVVDEVGQDVPEEWAGQRVFAFNPHESHFLASPEEVVPVPDGIESQSATLLPLVETAINFVHDGGPRLGERVAVFGQGTVGLLTTELLTRFPLDQLVAIDPVETRRKLARRLGVDRAIAPAALEEQYDSESEGAGTDLAFEVSGNPEALDDAIHTAGYDGRIVVGSWYGTKEATLDLGAEFHRNRITIESSQVSTVDPALRGRWDADRRLSTAWELLEDFDTEPLITHREPLSNAEIAYERLADKSDGVVTTLFEY